MSSICIFSALYLPNMGGVERFTDSLAGELVRQGHGVVVVTNDTHELGPRETLSSGLEIVRLPCCRLVGGRFPVPIYNESFKNCFAYLNGKHFDGVLINTRFYLHSLLGVKFADEHGMRAVVLDHGSAYLTLGRPIFDWAVARYEDFVTAYLKGKSLEFYGISLKSVEWLSHFGIKAQGVISNSIDAKAYRLQASCRSFRDELAIPKSDLMLSFTGRFIPEKGVGVLLEMMKKLQDVPVQLVMAGDGPLRSEVERSGLATVQVVGRLDSSDVAALLRESDLFCLPSRSEGFSTSLLEAAACGTPSLVTNVGGALELMPDDSYGFVMEEADVDSFASVVRRAAAGECDLNAMGKRCRLRVENRYSWAAVAQSFLNALS